MALSGNLKELRLGDVLQAVLSAGNRGMLRVRSTGRRAVLQVSPAGVRVLAPEVLSEKMIVDAFVARGVVTWEIAERAQAAAGEGSQLEVLASGGSIPADDLRALLVEAAEEQVLEVLSWNDGDFRFEEGVEPEGVSGPVAAIEIEPSGLLLKSAQRTDEVRRIADRFGGEVRFLFRVPDVEAQEPLEEPAPRVLVRLDGRTMLDEIALQEGLGFFAVQRAALALVEAGLARLPEPGELAQAAKSREEMGDLRGAFAILRQWQGGRPYEPEAFAAAVELAARHGRYEDEADALKALGRVWLKISRAREAREIYDRLLQKLPGDRDALAGLRLATRALHDEPGYSETTRRLAELAIEDGEAGQAATVLQELLEVQPADVDARILRTKALSRLADRAQAVLEIERIAELLPNPCRRKADRAAASWCRETLAQLAPDRSDLLRRFRTMTEAPEAARRRAFILGGFLLACSGLGFVFWPRPAVSLLDRAHQAADRGDSVTALALIAEIIDRWPDGSEAVEALTLKSRLDAAAREASRRVDPKLVEQVKTRAAAALAGFSRWPEPAAVADAEALAGLLRTPEGASVLAATTQLLRGPFQDAVSSLRRSAMTRRDALDLTESAAAHPPASLEKFRAIVDDAKAALDGTWVTSATRAAQVARKLLSALDETAIPSPLAVDVRAVDADVQATERAVAARPRSVERLQREYHRALIEDAYERARVDAGPLLVAGDLDRAEDHYARLSSLLQEVENDPALQPLRPALDGRRIGEFARAKMDMMATIRRGLEAAAAAEKAGNLAGAAAAYSSLVRRFELISFDRVFTIPLRVETVPAGARVEINGHLSGAAPAVVRYGWGAQAVITVSAEGFETQSVALRTADPDPDPVVKVSLSPVSRWSKPLVGVVEAPPLGVDGDVVLCNRAGRVERRAKESGEVLWSTDTRGVEGVKGRPALDAGMLWVPLLDGHVARISADTGNPVGVRNLPGRPVGDAAALAGRVAVATDAGVAIFSSGSEEPKVVPAPGGASAGIVAAHGAFWVGDSHGAVLRIDVVSLATTTIPTGGTDAITALSAGPRTVYAIGADGSLAAIDAGGARDARWRRPGLGDLSGAPAEASDVVAVADRTGRLHLLAAADGSPRGVREMGAEVKGGVLAVGSRILAVLADGRLCGVEAATGVLVLDAPFKGVPRFPAAHLGDSVLVLPAHGASVLLLKLPR